MVPARPDPSTDRGSPRRIYLTVAVAGAALAGLLIAIVGWSVATRPGTQPVVALQVSLVIASVAAMAGYVAWVFHRHLRDRGRVEAALRESEEKYRGLYEMSSDAVMVLDENQYLDCNESTLHVFRVPSKEEFCRLHPAKLSPATQPGGHDSMDLAIERIRRAMREGSLRFDWVHQRADGDLFPAEVVLSPAHFEGRPVLQALVRDITQRKQAEQALRQEQRALQRLLRAHDQERKLIAYEIHDGLAQQLVAAMYECQTILHNAEHLSDQAASAIGGLCQSLRRCLAETRRLISGVRPPILDEFGVVTAIEGLIEDTASPGGPHVEFHHEVQTQRLEPVLENTIFRIVQEGLSNACRHSRSAQVRVTLNETDQEVQVRVQDDGVGFDLDKVDQKRFGLAGIRERTRLLRGRVALRTAPGHGTTLEVHLPKDVGELAESHWDMPEDL